MTRSDDWIKHLPDCVPTDAFDAASFAEAVWLCQIELDLIDEGQEAADCYTKREVKRLRKFVADNQASIRSMTQ